MGNVFSLGSAFLSRGQVTEPDTGTYPADQHKVNNEDKESDDVFTGPEVHIDYTGGNVNVSKVILNCPKYLFGKLEICSSILTKCNKDNKLIEGLRLLASNNKVSIRDLKQLEVACDRTLNCDLATLTNSMVCAVEELSGLKGLDLTTGMWRGGRSSVSSVHSVQDDSLSEDLINIKNRFQALRDKLSQGDAT